MRHLSPFQFEPQPDGSMRVKDFPALTLNTIEQQGSVSGRNWQQELNLPTYFEEWEELARIRSDAPRGQLTFVLLDESPTNLPGHPRMRPTQIVLPTQCPLELGHTGFLIGSLDGYFLGRLPPGLTVPPLEGDFIVGQATFFDSALAEKAQEGVRHGIFTHVCPVLWTTEGASLGTGLLVQVSLVPGDFPGCPNSRVLPHVAVRTPTRRGFPGEGPAASSRKETPYGYSY